MALSLHEIASLSAVLTPKHASKSITLKTALANWPATGPNTKKLAVLQPGFKHIIMFHPPLRGGLSHASHCLESLISFPLIQWLYSSLFHLPQHLRHGPACPLGKLIWWNPANYILLTSSCLVSPSVRCLRVESFKYPGYTLDTAAYMASPRWALAIPRGGSPIEQTFEFVYWLSIL